MRLVLASDGIADLDAILRPGLVSLRTIRARGQDATAPALALWREFHALRTGLLSLAIETERETEAEAETANPQVAAWLLTAFAICSSLARC
ncbi:hypothetical protein [Altererythrobacter litoralis]|uniref:hypothetical protein n=1 Tax=Altererythrobacter litoralis TaxID=3113904 RepID=UPI00339B2DCE